MYNKPYETYLDNRDVDELKYDISLFSSRVKTLMRCNNISQGKLADELKINRATFSQIINSQRYININTLICLSDYFKVPIEFLAGNKNYSDDFNYIYDRVQGLATWEIIY